MRVLVVATLALVAGSLLAPGASAETARNCARGASPLLSGSYDVCLLDDWSETFYTPYGGWGWCIHPRSHNDLVHAQDTQTGGALSPGTSSAAAVQVRQTTYRDQCRGWQGYSHEGSGNSTSVRVAQSASFAAVGTSGSVRIINEAHTMAHYSPWNGYIQSSSEGTGATADRAACAFGTCVAASAAYRQESMNGGPCRESASASAAGAAVPVLPGQPCMVVVPNLYASGATFPDGPDLPVL